MYIWLACAGVFSFLLLYFFKLGTYNGIKRSSAIPGPKCWPIIGALPNLPKDPNHIMQWIYDYYVQYDFQPWAFFLNRDQIMVCDPADLEHITKTKFDNYVKGEKFHQVFFDALGNGVFNVDGALWKSHRKAASYLFAAKKLRAFQDEVFQRDAQQLATILREKADARSEVDLQAMMMSLTWDSFASLAFGANFEALQYTAATNKRLPEMASFDEVFSSINKRFLLPMTWWRLMRYLGIGREATLKTTVAEMRKIVDKIADERRDALASELEERSDLLSLYIVYARKSGQEDVMLTDEYLRDMILNFILAGRDTTALLLCNFLRCTSKCPEVLEAIGREVKQLLPTADDKISFDVLSRATYTEAALYEVLRLFPSVPAEIKTAIDDDVLPSGVAVAAGDAVVWSLVSMGRNKKLWGDDAFIFDPTRWLEKRGPAFADESKMSYVFPAFLSGPRMCLGKPMALLEAKNCVITLVRAGLSFQMSEPHDDLHDLRRFTHAPVALHTNGVCGTMHFKQFY